MNAIKEAINKLTNAPSIGKIAKEIGICKPTLYKAMETPERCSRKSLELLCKYLKLKWEDVIEDIWWEKL